jgi:phosphoribosylanthranilate isomerase
MNRVRVKICGVRSLEEAEVAVEAGADALGFNFWPQSPRYIDPREARSVVRQLSPPVSAIGVFVNEDHSRILEIVADVGLNAVQLHGDETPEFCTGLGSIKTIKAIRVADYLDCASINRFPVSAILLDTSIKGSYGGTGKRFNWSIAREAKRHARIILAGGLAIENVAEAITTVNPFALDVCSGVEAEPGRKDPDKLRSFMAEVARANELNNRNQE